ncbi:MAG: HepT-like ribonuclease domain-containing protein [Planctomycetota bacterium]
MRHMLDHAREATDLVQGRNRDDLDADRLLSLALVRLLEIIGEAAGRVSNQIRTKHPGIPWPQIISLRNRLIHGYDAVDKDILWEIVTRDLPPLIEILQVIPGVENNQ